MPRPGSHTYDIKRTRRRKQLEDQGIATDADVEANRQLQEDEGMTPQPRTERAKGPKGERPPQSND